MFYPTYQAKASVYDPRPNVALASVAYTSSGGYDDNLRMHTAEYGRPPYGRMTESQTSPQKSAVLTEINNSMPSPVRDLNGWDLQSSIDPSYQRRSVTRVGSKMHSHVRDP